MIDFWARRRTINLLTWEDKAMLGSNLSACVRPGYHAGEASARGFSRPELYLGSNALNPALRLTDLFDQRSVLPTGVPNGNISGAACTAWGPCATGRPAGVEDVRLSGCPISYQHPAILTYLLQELDALNVYQLAGPNSPWPGNAFIGMLQLSIRTSSFLALSR